MPVSGGVPQRLTFLDSECYVLGWLPRTNHIFFASNTAQPFSSLFKIYTVNLAAEMPEQLPVGAATHITFGPNSGQVIGRNTTDLAKWKRYRGGLTGDLWIDVAGTGQFQRLLKIDGNITCPLWLEDRIYFVSDHQGVGNIYSCNTAGQDLRRHTNHSDFYVRFPSTDGQRIVYQCGADLYYLIPEENSTTKIEISLRSSMPQKSRKFASPWRYLEYYELAPRGQALALVSRGKAFAMFNWEGGVRQFGNADSVRYRLLNWLNDHKRVIVISDATQEEALEIHHLDASRPVERLEQLDLGRTLKIAVSPTEDRIALSNHRLELLLIDLAQKTSTLIDKSEASPIYDISWSPDGNWLVYSKKLSVHIQALFLYHLKTGEVYELTKPYLHDFSPAWDPAGKYIYFLSCRTFEPVDDNLHFNLSFPLGVRPYLITLKTELPSPFLPPVPDLNYLFTEDKIEEAEKSDKPAETDAEKIPEKEETPEIKIDLENIQSRILAFPVAEGRYSTIVGIKGKALYTIFPLAPITSGNYAKEGALRQYDFEERKEKTLKSEISGFKISRNNKTLIYRQGNKLRIVSTEEKDFSKLTDTGYTKKSGWINLSRIKLKINPLEEWRQMFREAWRLQRDYFWTEDMSGIDWEKIYQQYYPLIDRLGTRREMADLVNEMQGELGTSHAFHHGGDYRTSGFYKIGFLGADFEFDPATEGYVIKHIVQGNSWDEKMKTPLQTPGQDVHEGDILLAINGQRLSKNYQPNRLLLNQSENEVFLTIQKKTPPNELAAGVSHIVTVTTCRSESPLRYREWVAENRKKVHQATAGRVGYIHIPDMMPSGYAEFHRSFLSEIDREGLIVDVRFNRGGYVSELILEKLARRRLGYETQRWGRPIPYPRDSIIGPIVAIANEFSASDGDIFSHGFKLMNLGPLIGKRTWGGVIGIAYRTTLVDGGVTTQPEFSFWFKDIGLKLENYGTEPDIEVEVTPQDFVAQHDPQLERGVAVILETLEKNPPQIPNFGKRPRLDFQSQRPARNLIE
jgi:tricorn protease